MAPFPLFERYPKLAQQVPRIELGDLPTPVQRLASLEKLLKTENLHVKRDDLSAVVYGGNKVRKLEFLLAEAQSSGAKSLVTCGGAGSNHALATAIFGRRLGFRVVLVLVGQPPSPTVRANLLGDLWAGAELHHFDSYGEYAAAQQRIARETGEHDGVAPFVIPVGGTTPRAVIGFVNAGFELAGQIAQGRLPPPSAVVVPFGSMGTAIGLGIGLKAAGLKSTRIRAVQVVPDAVGSEPRARALWADTVGILRKIDSSFPNVGYTEAFSIERGYFGGGYGLPTAEAAKAIDAMQRAEGLALEGTYSGKACAAFFDCARNKGESETIVFWDTFSSRSLPKEALAADFHLLPPAFHRYFEDASDI